MASSLRRQRVLHIVGARPNFMKIAPIIREMSARSDAFEQVLVHTGQHYDEGMSAVFFRDLEIPEPAFNLGVGSGSHSWQVAQTMLRFEPVANEITPDWVVVVGDVNATLSCALVAERLGVKVAHVEAGLRSYDRSMPEEINRLLTDQLASLLLTPSEDASANLVREGIDESKIRFVGNVMIDSLVRALPAARARQRELARQFGLDRYALVTLHRPGNVDVDARLADLLRGLNQLSDALPVVFPVHPRTAKAIERSTVPATAAVKRLEPMGYADFLALMTGASLVITDSGGVQEETTFLGIPCLTLRPNTERPITISMGTNRLVKAGEDLAAAAFDAMKTTARERRCPPLWDGRAAQRIADAILEQS